MTRPRLADLLPLPKVQACTWSGLVVDDAKEAFELYGAGVPVTHIAHALRTRGYALSNSSVTRHLTGECKACATMKGGTE